MKKTVFGARGRDRVSPRVIFVSALLLIAVMLTSVSCGLVGGTGDTTTAAASGGNNSSTHSGAGTNTPSDPGTDSPSDPVGTTAPDGSDGTNTPSQGETNTPSQGSNTDAPTTPADDNPTLDPGAAELPEGTAEAGYLDKIMFYGDSTTYGLRYYEIFGSKTTDRVWTPKSGTLALFNATKEKIYDASVDAEFTLSEMAARKKPEYLIITLGINGISIMDEEYFKSEYIKLINIIRDASPSTKIILQTMYPVSSLYEQTDSINMTKIKTGNGWIADIAEETGCRFLNSFDWFLGSDGLMDSKYDNRGDGMHFNADGYKHMLEFVEAHPYR